MLQLDILHLTRSLMFFDPILRQLQFSLRSEMYFSLCRWLVNYYWFYHREGMWTFLCVLKKALEKTVDLKQWFFRSGGLVPFQIFILINFRWRFSGSIFKCLIWNHFYAIKEPFFNLVKKLKIRNDQIYWYIQIQYKK